MWSVRGIVECWRESWGRQIGKLIDRRQSQYDDTDVRVVSEHRHDRRRDVVGYAGRVHDCGSAVVRGCLVHVESNFTNKKLGVLVTDRCAVVQLQRPDISL